MASANNEGGQPVASRGTGAKEVLAVLLGRSYIALIYLAMMAPLVIIVGVAVTSATFISFPPEDLSLRWFETIVQSASWREGFRVSMTIAVGAAVVSTSIGVSLAFALNRYDFRFAPQLWGLGALPLLVPPIIVAVAMMSYFLQLGIWGTPYAVMLAHGIMYSPFSFILVSSGLDEIDTELEEAARNLGASKLQTLRTITFPLIFSNIVVAVLFGFILSLNEYLVASYVGGPGVQTIPVLIFSSLRYNYSPIIAAISVVYMVLTVAVMYVIDRRLGGNLW